LLGKLTLVRPDYLQIRAACSVPTEQLLHPAIENLVHAGLGVRTRQTKALQGRTSPTDCDRFGAGLLGCGEEDGTFPSGSSRPYCIPDSDQGPVSPPASQGIGQSTPAIAAMCPGSKCDGQQHETWYKQQADDGSKRALGLVVITR
jgi:hypothetical protein